MRVQNNTQRVLSREILPPLTPSAFLYPLLFGQGQPPKTSDEPLPEEVRALFKKQLIRILLIGVALFASLFSIPMCAKTYNKLSQPKPQKSLFTPVIEQQG